MQDAVETDDSGEWLMPLRQHSQSLWSIPLGDLVEHEDDEIDVLDEEAELPELEGKFTHLFSRRGISRETPLEQSPSGKAYLSASRSVKAFSSPTMSIKSREFSFATSRRPLPRRPVPSLMSSILTASKQRSAPNCTNSKSRITELPSGEPTKLTESTGTRLIPTNACYYTKVTDRPISQGRLRSRYQ